jgi:hypothetical protein
VGGAAARQDLVRGTLHLLVADEMPTWVAGLSTYRHFERPSWQRASGVSPAQLERLIETVGEALAGRELTRAELATEVGRRTGVPELADAVRQSWGAMLKPAAFRGQLCFAPGSGQLVRFTRPDTWLGAESGGRLEVDPQEALLSLTRRYLCAFGPASREALARWFGLPPAQAGRLLRALGSEVLPVDVEGTAGWALAETAEQDALALPDPAGPPLVRLLPAFDQYVVAGPRDEQAVLPAALKGRVFRPQGWLSPVLVVDGRIEGVWRHERRGSRVAVTVEPFAPQAPPVLDAIEEEKARLLSFLG